MTAARTRCFSVVAIFMLAHCSGQARAQQDFDRESYYRAVEYCRGDVSRPLALSPDGLILCFNGFIGAELDISLARKLKEDGLFVVRSNGGSSLTAVALSNIVRDRRAAVIVHNHCFSACAQYFLIASHQTYVLKGALVAWHHSQSRDPDDPFCTYLIEPRDGEPKKLQRGPCQAGGEQGARLWPELARFFEERVNPPFDPPADSLYVRRIVRNYHAQTGVFHDVAWTLHPRYYPVLFKTKIFYEAYPQSQEEVDGMAARLTRMRIIYDP